MLVASEDLAGVELAISEVYTLFDDGMVITCEHL